MPEEFPEVYFSKEMGVVFLGGGLGLVTGELTSKFFEGITNVTNWHAVGLRAIWKTVLGLGFFAAADAVKGEEMKTALKAAAVVVPATILYDVIGKLTARSASYEKFFGLGEKARAKLMEKIAAMRARAAMPAYTHPVGFESSPVVTVTPALRGTTFGIITT